MPRGPVQPSRTFAENLKVARGFVRVQFYVEDFFETGGKESVGQVRRFTNEIFEVIGVGKGGLEGFVREHIEPDLDAKLERLPKEEVQRRLEAWFEKNRVRLGKVADKFQEIVMAYRRGLLLQAVVIAASAFEVYLNDLTVDLVAMDKRVRNQFAEVFRKDFKYSHLEEADYDLGRALGDVAAKSIQPSSAASIQRHVSKLAGKKVDLFGATGVSEFQKWRQYRNMAAHTAGIANAEFLRQTHYRGKVGEPVTITRRTAENCIEFFAGLGSRVQEACAPIVKSRS